MEEFIVSARKYRPQTFKDVVGQQAITNTLLNAIETNHLAQALLFTGPRGVGKTTCARILARKINQESIECRLGQHVHLIDDIHFVLPGLWRDTNLVNQAPDIVYRVIGSRIEFKHIKSKIFGRVIIAFLVYFTGQYSGAGCFSQIGRASCRERV